jgi:hypothetical protein
LVAGHQVAYAALHARASDVVSNHPHGHLEPLTALALPLAIAGAGWLASRSNRDLFLPAMAILAGVQVLAFAVMETAERLAAGGDVAALARSPLLWVGLAVQIATAGAVGLTVRGAGRAAIGLPMRSMTVMASVSGVVPALRPSGQQPPRPLAVTRWLLQRGPPVLLGP